MAIRYFALIFGLVYGLVGILGFFPGVTTSPPADAPPLAVDMAYGYVFGLFPVNVLHNLVHLAIGLWGVVSFPRLDASRFYARAVTVIFAVLAVLGIIPGLNTMFGLTPLFGHDIWLHVLTTVVAGYFGFVARPSGEPALGGSARY